jgi:hypothetical protein
MKTHRYELRKSSPNIKTSYILYYSLDKQSPSSYHHYHHNHYQVEESGIIHFVDLVYHFVF